MARITVEDCLENVANRFCLVRLAAKRAKQILSGSPAVTDFRGNREIVGALREIADGKVRFVEKDKSDFIESDNIAEELIGADVNTTVVDSVAPAAANGSTGVTTNESVAEATP